MAPSELSLSGQLPSYDKMSKVINLIFFMKTYLNLNMFLNISKEVEVSL